MIVALILAGIVVLFGCTAFFGAPYVPSHRAQVQRAFRDLRPLKRRDVLVDLGCGDGVVLRAAVSAGVGRAVGIELNPVLGAIARLLSRHRAAVEVRIGNMWTTHPPGDTTVVYVFGVGRDMKKLEAMLASWSEELQRPLDLILYGHTLPGRQPERTVGAHHLYHF